MHARPIFQFLRTEGNAGRRTVLVTVTAVTGASTRNPGTHMAVSESGAFAGSLSGGCIEQAVVAEALDTLADGAPRQVRFGAGSRYIDIRLPCGGAIDLLFNPLEDASFANAVHDALAARSPVILELPSGEGTPGFRLADPGADVSLREGGFEIGHWPALRTVILGHGGSVDALRQQAVALGVETCVLTPDQSILDNALADGAEGALLTMHGPSAALAADRWTAIVFYFHDHDWEGPLLAQALETPAFFVGAMGSRKTHVARLHILKNLGVSDEACARIVSPIGLIPSSRDPETLALSTLSQIVAIYHERLAAALGR